MSNLTQDFRLVVLQDQVQLLSPTGVESTVLAVIGQRDSIDVIHAYDIQFAPKVNAVKTLTFKIHYQYFDAQSGQLVDNPLTSNAILANESHLRLTYEGKDYDFLVKTIVKDSANKCFTYTATDYAANELSKNGFSTVLSDDLHNNTGTGEELARNILKDSGWYVGGDCLSQTVDTKLVALRIGSGNPLNGSKHIIDSGANVDRDGFIEESLTPGGANQLIYVAYSALTSAAKRCMYFYKTNAAGSTNIDFNTDDSGIITDKDCQYYLDNPSYVYDSTWQMYRIGGTVIVGFVNDCKGKSYNYQQQTVRNAALGRIVHLFRHPTTQTVYHGWYQTDVVAPTLLPEFSANGKDFKSTSGWRTLSFSGSTYDDLSVDALNSNGTSLMSALIAGSTVDPADYPTYIKWNTQNHTGVIANDSFHANAASIAKLKYTKQGTTFEIRITLLSRPAEIGLTAYVTDISYEDDRSDIINHAILSFTSWSTISGTNTYYARATLSEAIPEEVFAVSNYQLYLMTNRNNVVIKELSIFPYLLDDSGNQITHDNETTETNTHSYWTYYAASDYTSGKAVSEYEFYDESILTNLVPIYNPKAAQTHSLSLKESNYFNNIQKLCEAYTCWADLRSVPTGRYAINAYEKSRGPVSGYTYYIDGGSTAVTVSTFLDGHTYELAVPTKKMIYLANYIGQINDVGIRYGVNLKSIQRTYESKELVSKLIVKSNSNEFAEAKSCSIQTAPGNETGESSIFDFRYYVQQGLLSAADLNAILYNVQAAAGADMNDSDLWNQSTSGMNAFGTYPRLSLINKLYRKYANLYAQASAVLNATNASYTVAQTGLTNATTLAEKAKKEFYDTAVDSEKNHFAYDEINNGDRRTRVQNSSSLNSLLTQIAQYLSAKTQFESDLIVLAAKKADDEEAISNWETKLNTLVGYKETLLRYFYLIMYRFIQEGTWIDESYSDAQAYYMDAIGVMSNSNMPKVSYSISALELSQLVGYESLSFNIGDRTYIEDPEFFGYAADGVTPYREEVVITGITYNLTDPSKNTITVQNYRSQFEDLFKSITATVQSVQYSTGAYQQAAALAQASAQQTVQYLQNALAKSSAEFAQAGEQSVTWGTEGIKIVDKNEPSKYLQLIGGGIALHDLDSAGADSVVMSLTSDGISADVINSGVINTSKISLMNGADATFKIDALGITAYDFTYTNSTIGPLNPQKGIRIDRLGIYEFHDLDGITLNPATDAGFSADTAHHAFGMTRNEGFWMNLSTANESPNDNYAFSINKDGLWLKKTPSGSTTSENLFKVDLQGNVELEGKITAKTGTIGGWSIESNRLYTDELNVDNATMGFAGTGVFQSLVNSPIGQHSELVMRLGTASNAKFGLAKDGTLYAANGFFSGTLNSTTGSIGGLTLSANGFSFSNIFELSNRHLKFGDSEHGYILLSNPENPSPGTGPTIYIASDSELGNCASLTVAGEYTDLDLGSNGMVKTGSITSPAGSTLVIESTRTYLSDDLTHTLASRLGGGGGGTTTNALSIGAGTAATTVNFNGSVATSIRFAGNALTYAKSGNTLTITATDHITTATTSGTGNAVTAITSDANGNLIVIKGSTFLTSAALTNYISTADIEKSTGSNQLLLSGINGSNYQWQRLLVSAEYGDQILCFYDGSVNWKPKSTVGSWIVSGSGTSTKWTSLTINGQTKLVGSVYTGGDGIGVDNSNNTISIDILSDDGLRFTEDINPQLAIDFNVVQAKIPANTYAAFNHSHGNTYAPFVHFHNWMDIGNGIGDGLFCNDEDVLEVSTGYLDDYYAAINHSHSYDDLSDKPSIPSSPSDIGAAAENHSHGNTYAPLVHVHNWIDIDNGIGAGLISDDGTLEVSRSYLDDYYAAIDHSHSYNDLSDKPSIPSSPRDIGAAAADHYHSGRDIYYGWGLNIDDDDNLIIDSEDLSSYYATRTWVVRNFQPRTCLIEGTKIKMYDGTEKNIEDIKPGDSILTYDVDNHINIEGVAIATICTGATDDYEAYIFDDGTYAEVYGRHSIWNVEVESPKQVAKWTLGEHGLSIDLTQKALISVDEVHHSIFRKHYVLITNNNLYYANGTLMGHWSAAKYNFIKNHLDYAHFPEELMTQYKTEAEWNSKRSEFPISPEILAQSSTVLANLRGLTKQSDDLKELLNKTDYSVTKVSEAFFRKLKEIKLWTIGNIKEAFDTIKDFDYTDRDNARKQVEALESQIAEAQAQYDAIRKDHIAGMSRLRIYFRRSSRAGNKNIEQIKEWAKTLK